MATNKQISRPTGRDNYRVDIEIENLKSRLDSAEHFIAQLHKNMSKTSPTVFFESQEELPLSKVPLSKGGLGDICGTIG